MTITDWQQKVTAKQAEAAGKIPADWRLSPEILQQVSANQQRTLFDIPRESGLLTAHELAITETQDATELRDQLAAGKLSAVDVTTAFCKRAAIAQQVTSCLTETLFPQALERAKQLDEHLATTGKPIGPLHGLPVSIKESFSIRGIPTSLGFVSFLDRPPVENNSATVDLLLKAGAVLYVKTNIPQTMMTADSHNNVFGRVKNPHRQTLTAGGSTGGEGALVAMRGSILGIGTDVAGSIRIPSICCGTIGFKPSVGRVPYAGQTGPGRAGMAGIGIPAVAGPLCHSVRDAELLLRVVCDTSAEGILEDDVALGFPWIQPSQPQSTTLTIGVLPEDPQFPLHPNMQRTLATAVEKLAAAGQRIVDLSGKGCPSLTDIKDIALKFFGMDPDGTPLKHIANGNEPVIPSMGATYDLESKGPEPTLRDLFKLNVAREEITATMRRIYRENQLDIILSPGFQSCAVPHDTYRVPVYTILPNLVDVFSTPFCSPRCSLKSDADDGLVPCLHHPLWQSR